MAYHIQKDRWDCWDLGGITVDANSGAFTGINGEVYFSNATQTVELLGGGSRQSFEWTSQEITLDRPSQEKKWYSVENDVSGTVTTTFGVEGASPTTSLTSGNIGTTYTRAKTLMIKHSGSGILKSTAILMRRLYGGAYGSRKAS